MGSKETKDIFMSDYITNIVKYNVHIKYFETWSPWEIHDTYHKLSHDPRATRTVSVEHITYSYICDILWSEMSLNPKRFGEYSPFEFNGKNNIHKFIENNISNDKTPVFKQVAQSLQTFITYMNKSHTTNKRPFKTITIGLDNTKANTAYNILSSLSKSVHIIATKNNNDKNKKAFRTAMERVIRDRFPELVRPTQNVNFAAIERDLSKTKKLIQEKQSEIYDSQMKIDNLSEYEDCPDLISEKLHKKKLEKQLRDLEFDYDMMTR